MQSKTDVQYRYICHTVNHFSKLHVIFLLVSKKERVVANGIKIHVFSYFGLPKSYIATMGLSLLMTSLPLLLCFGLEKRVSQMVRQVTASHNDLFSRETTAMRIS